jgi:hypothetical protein
MVRLEDPTNYLMKDIPEFDLIFNLYRKLYLRIPSLSEIREIQKMRNEQESSSTSERIKKPDTAFLL